MIKAMNEKECIDLSLQNDTRHLIISITDPSAPLPEFSRKAIVHRFCFRDLEFAVGDHNGCNDLDIDNISKVITQWDSHTPLYVHCSYGASRSVAVALAASIFHNRPVIFNEYRACPNRRIARMLDESLGLKGELIRECFKYNGFIY